MQERAPAGEDRPILPHDIERCGGFLAEARHERCPRRFDCARFLAATGAGASFHIAVCERRGADVFLPVSHGTHDASARGLGVSLVQHAATNETGGA